MALENDRKRASKLAIDIQIIRIKRFVIIVLAHFWICGHGKFYCDGSEVGNSGGVCRECSCGGVSAA